MAKMGRPKSDVVKDKILTMRVTPKEYELIKQYALSHNLTITQLLQQGVRQIMSTP